MIIVNVSELSGNNFVIPGDLSRFFHNSGSRAEFFHGKVHRAFHFFVVERAEKAEVEVNGGKKRRVFVFFAFGIYFQLDVVELLALFAQQVHDVDGAAGAQSHEHQLHGPEGLVAAADVGRAVGLNGVADFIGRLHVIGVVEAGEFYFHMLRFTGQQVLNRQTGFPELLFV